MPGVPGDSMTEEIIYRALDSEVLATAVINPAVGDWSAYIGAVPGKNHEQEKTEVARTGNKLDTNIAVLIFPNIAARYKWRD